MPYSMAGPLKRIDWLTQHVVGLIDTIMCHSLDELVGMDNEIE